MHALLGRCSLAQVPLVLKAKSVVDGLVTRGEYDEIIKLLCESLPLESQGRTRCATLIATNHAITLAGKLGRSDKTVAFMRSLSQPLPRAWELAEEKEALAANGEVDLLVDEELEELEEEEAHFAAELVQFAPYAIDEADDLGSAAQRTRELEARLLM